MVRLLLASASPARAATLRHAGIDPVIRVSAVDEEALLASQHEAVGAGVSSAPAQVQLLARAKADDVAAHPDAAGFLVLGCDSMFEFAGQLHGKPRDAIEARSRIASMAGHSGVLHTGHWLIDNRAPADPGASPQGRAVGAAVRTIVHFGPMTAHEIDAYVATGEPLAVAGSFTIDGLGGPFIDGVEGDHHSVVGLSLPLLRRLLAELDLSITQLWGEQN